MAVMVIELDRSYYREVPQTGWLLWLAVALSLAALGAMLALTASMVLALAPAAAGLGIVASVLVNELEVTWKKSSLQYSL
jgi:CHASE2 domain-containing sensor protein